MRHIIYIIILLFICVSCEKNDFVDTGTPNGIFNGSILEYLKANPNEFSLTVRVIHNAGLDAVFDGTDPAYQNLTFLAFNNFAITRFLLQTVDDDWTPLYKTVDDIPVERLRPMVLSHVLKGKFLRSDIDYEVKGTFKGGNKYQTLAGDSVRMFCREVEYNGIIDKRAASLYVQGSGEDGEIVYVVGADHQMTNGNLHILSNTYQWSIL